MDSRSNKKNIVQDVLPPKRSIRNIELPDRKERLADVVPTVKKTGAVKIKKIQKPESAPIQTPVQTPTEPSPVKYKFEYNEDLKKKSSRKGLFFSVCVLLLAAGFGVSALFKSATVKVVPQSETVPLSANLTAKKDDTSGNLSYQTVTLSKDLEKTVQATGEEQVSKKATGTIVVYNNYSTTAQNLVANTRFQTPEGLIYHAVSSITIPGKKTVSGKTVPGSVDVSVIADQPGADYNVGLKDFSVPGFRNDPAKFGKIFARSKTPMTGGFVGKQKNVSADVISQSENELTANLKDYLSKEISSQIPADFVLYPDSISYSFEPMIQSESSGSQSAILRKKGTASAVIFNRKSLSDSLIGKSLQNVSSDQVKIVNLDNLVFSYASGTPSTFDPKTSTSLNFTLTGDAQFVWFFDADKLKADLLGLPKEKGLTVISSYKSIKEAWIETRPFWNSTIPNNENKVKLVNTLELK